MSGYRYRAFGLRIESARSISSLEASEFPFDGLADVEILEGQVRIPESPQSIDGMKVGVKGESFFISIPDCGWFQVIGGRRIIVQPDPSVTSDQVDLYLLGSVFGALLHQRGLLPFHCSAVEIEGSAFLFCGDSGAGKSTLAAHFAERGIRLLGDDLCALNFSRDGRLTAASGVTRLKLWQDTLERFGRSSAGLTLVPWYDDKFEVRLTEGSPKDPLPVSGIYHLRRVEAGRVSGIHPLKGIEAANSITANIYRRRFADLSGAAASYLSATARIAGEVPIFAMNRTWGFVHFGKEALAAEDHMRQLAREPASARL